MTCRTLHPVRVSAAAILVWVVAVAAAAGPAGAAAAGRSAPSGCARLAAGDVRVAVVIDFGTVGGAGSPGSVVRACVAVPSRATGAVALAAASHALGLADPWWNPDGFLCGIGGYPATGCAESGGSSTPYWAYWKGTGRGWSYADVGAAVPSNVVSTDRTEGWRLLAGNSATDPAVAAPRASPSPSSVCPPAAPVTTAGPSPVLGSPTTLGRSVAPTTAPAAKAGRAGPTTTRRPVGSRTGSVTSTTTARRGGVAHPSSTTSPAPDDPKAPSLAEAPGRVPATGGADGPGGSGGWPRVGVGLALVTMVAGAAGIVARRRAAS